MADLPDGLVRDLREEAKSNLYFFAKAVMGFDWLDEKIHIPLCLLLEDHEKNTRLKITLPRGWLKTTVCSQAYPVWRAINDPNVRVLLAQNTFTNACAKLKVIRECFEKNALFKALFPELLPDAGCVWKSDSLCVKRTKSFPESTFEAAGTRTQVTSRHYDVIIEDDTVAPELSDLKEDNLCPTKEDIVQAIGWHRLVLPLLTNPAKAQNIVVGTRWFEKDLLSWIDGNESKTFLSYTRAVRENEAGEPDENAPPAYPERFDKPVLDQLFDALGPYMYSCLYMNKPIRSSDMTFHQDWFTYYEEEAQALAIFTTVDVADDPETTKGDPDWNVVLTCGKDMVRGVVYVLDYWRAKCNPGEMIDALFQQVRRWHPLRVGVETVAYQGSLLYWIREKMQELDCFFRLEGLKHGRKSKGMRITALQPLVLSKMLLFRTWMTQLVNEMLAFPLGANDDLADTLSMQLGMWRMTKAKHEVFNLESRNPALSATVAIKHLRKRYEDAQTKENRIPFDVFDRPGSALVFGSEMLTGRTSYDRERR